MRRPSIRLALISMLSAIGACVIVLSYLSIGGISSTNSATEEIATRWLPSVRLMSAMNKATSDYRIAEAALIMASDEAERSEAQGYSTALQEHMSALKTRYEPLISSVAERQLYERFLEEWSNYEKLHDQMVELALGNATQEASDLFQREARLAFDRACAVLEELIRLNSNGSDKAFAQSQEAYSDTTFVTYVAATVIFSVLAVSAYFAISGISRPINVMTASMTRLSDGDDQSAIPFKDRSDEIGAMAGAVEVFRQNSIANKRLEQEALANRSEVEKARVAEQQRVAREAEQLRFATTSLGENLKRLANGDLTCQIGSEFAPAYEGLRHDFNTTVDQLTKTVSAVVNAIGNIESGTREIASGAADLSKRTEQQAAALEETAAALDQITVNVGSSSKMTEEARNVAQAASRSAKTSADVVSDAEEAMQRIEQSSQQISNIIGVIDEIAFQTNLLALNAGVEAARAGDAGKGFAVVAQEVRELAQRSAQAAKEIKGLILNSTTEVESGVKLVRDTGDALKTIGDYIARINSHMEAIATSSREQSTGLSEVNVAVNQMDQTTQQNAAMVEQSTAAASSLSIEAGKLSELVTMFQLHHDGNRWDRGTSNSRGYSDAPLRHTTKNAA